MLDVSNGNSIYWECCGNPNGKPAVYLHGGPGSGCTPGERRFFDPEEYKIVLFDQRGCGRSRPLLNERSQLQSNTTQHLVADLESLRKYLAIERWVMLGISWGTTLALAYAQSFPQNVAALVLASVTTTSRKEVDWITCGVGRIFPRQWERFVSHIPESLEGERIVDAYAKLLFDNDPSVSAAAAAEWCAWEDSHVSLAPGHVPNRRFLAPEFRLRFARLVTHYWRHSAFLDEDQLLRNAALLNGIPGVLIHGRYDVSSALEIPWKLHRSWAESELHVVDDAGHGSGSLPERIVEGVHLVKRTIASACAGCSASSASREGISKVENSKPGATEHPTSAYDAASGT
jgi:proline iminopeptidase